MYEFYVTKFLMLTSGNKHTQLFRKGKWAGKEHCWSAGWCAMGRQSSALRSKTGLQCRSWEGPIPDPADRGWSDSFIRNTPSSPS